MSTELAIRQSVLSPSGRLLDAVSPRRRPSAMAPDIASKKVFRGKEWQIGIPHWRAKQRFPASRLQMAPPEQ